MPVLCQEYMLFFCLPLSNQRRLNTGGAYPCCCVAFTDTSMLYQSKNDTTYFGKWGNPYFGKSRIWNPGNLQIWNPKKIQRINESYQNSNPRCPKIWQGLEEPGKNLPGPIWGHPRQFFPWTDKNQKHVKILAISLVGKYCCCVLRRLSLGPLADYSMANRKIACPFGRGRA